MAIIRTPINKDRLKHHLAYNSWKYVLVAVVGVSMWSLIYTQTAYRSPQDKRIDVYVKTSTTTSERMDAFLAPIWHSTVPDMETVSSVALMQLDDEYTSNTQLMLYLATGEGDLYLLPAKDFKTFAAQGSFVALDEYVASGALNVEGVDLKSGYVATYNEDDELNTTAYLYGIPLDSYYGYMSNMNLDNRGMYMCIAILNQNEDNVVKFMDALLQAGVGEKPEWLIEQ